MLPEWSKEDVNLDRRLKVREKAHAKLVDLALLIKDLTDLNRQLMFASGYNGSGIEPDTVGEFYGSDRILHDERLVALFNHVDQLKKLLATAKEVTLKY